MDLVPVLALAVTAATLVAVGFGVARAWRRRWRAAVVFGGLSIAGGVTSFVGLPALGAFTLAYSWRGTDGDPGDRARVLAETISETMNWGAVGLVGIPVGLVLAIVGAVGWWRTGRQTLLPLETAVMSKLLAGELPALAVLREQFATITVKAREFSGVGFFTSFTLPPDTIAAPMKAAKVMLGDVDASIAGLVRGAGFLLYVTDGKLDMLEGFTYEEPWPARVTSFELRYRDSERSELDRLR